MSEVKETPEATTEVPPVKSIAFPETFEVVESLIKKVSWLNRAIVAKPIVPVLENLLFSNGVIYASDLTTTAMHYTNIKGQFLMPAKKLESILKSLNKKDEVSFRISDDRLFLFVNGEETFGFDLEDVSDYPKFPVKETNLQVADIKSEEDMDNIQVAVGYSTNDGLRPHLNGVFINGQHIVATNGHYLMWRKSVGTVITEPEYSFIIPTKVVGLIKDFKYATVHKDDLDNNLLIKQEKRAVLYRRVDGKYPAYEQVIPTYNSIVVEIDKKAFLDALKLGSEAANRTTWQMKLAFGKERDIIVLSTEDLDFRYEFKRKVIANVVQGPDEFAIGFNLKFMTEIVKDVDSKTIQLKMSAPNKAIIVSDDVLVMPIMLNQYV